MPFKMDDSGIRDVIDRVSDNNIAQLVEAVAVTHRNYLRRHTLNAPGPPPPARNPLYPDQLRRITGQLGDTLGIRRDGLNARYFIDVIADYGIRHIAAFENAITENEPDLTAVFESGLEQLLRG